MTARFAGAILFGVAIVVVAAMLWRSAMRQAQIQAFMAFAEHDPSEGFLVDEAGRILRHGESLPSQDTLAEVLRPLVADAEATMDRLLARARESGFANEALASPDRKVRLSVHRVAPDLAIWRMERDGAERTEIASVQADAEGAILSGNAAFRALGGILPQHIDELAADAPLRLGRVQFVSCFGDRRLQLVAEATRLPGGNRTILLLPPPEIQPGLGEWAAVEDLPVPLLKIGPSGVILAANRHARTLLPMPLGPDVRLSDILEGLGRPIIEWVSDVMDGRPNAGPQVLRGSGAYQDTVVRVSLSPAGPADTPQLIAVLDDVSELKALEAQFTQSQKMQALGQLAGGVAHDFNNLLTAISGHCDLLLLRHDEGDLEYADLIQIRHNVNRAASLVGQLLAFSRKQNMMPETLDLRDALSDLTHLLNRLVGEKVSLALHHDPALLHVRADRRQLEQVIMNLVVNARDAMPTGGTIRIETTNRHLDLPQTIGRANVPAGRYVLVQVTDEGVGIPPDRLSKIFEPFYTTKKPGEGTGLGLSTVYGIVKQSGGFIFVESEVGRGSTFTLWLPAHDRPKDEAPRPVSQRPVLRPTTATILLVEDEDPVRAFAARALRLRGHNVREAATAAAALDVLSDPDLQLDLILTDVVLPDMDGPSWVQAALATRPGLKVIFASGYAEETFTERKAQVPGSVFLPKPFSLTELTALVERQLSTD
ncbi:hybrid sensor histidine kinase/response regulator [Rubellimicrobium arenae]|uniref:hybrid sensor histidine kinase/response regulator n=1 Tax=Rubellimicrobium arenae TaxID=2817372 RepID=UPI001B30F261|nr:ATP-binding protein [Rubellimicrobium arenae]